MLSFLLLLFLRSLGNHARMIERNLLVARMNQGIAGRQIQPACDVLSRRRIPWELQRLGRRPLQGPQESAREQKIC